MDIHGRLNSYHSITLLTLLGWMFILCDIHWCFYCLDRSCLNIVNLKTNQGDIFEFGQNSIVTVWIEVVSILSISKQIKEIFLNSGKTQ